MLLGFPLVYGVWHSYKYCVELIYRAFLLFIKFLEHGNRRQLAGLHQMQTTAGSASTTSEPMFLYLDRLEDEHANEYTLLHHITVMLEECGVTAEEGTGVFRFLIRSCRSTWPEFLPAALFHILSCANCCCQTVGWRVW